MHYKHFKNVEVVSRSRQHSQRLRVRKFTHSWSFFHHRRRLPWKEGETTRQFSVVCLSGKVFIAPSRHASLPDVIIFVYMKAVLEWILKAKAKWCGHETGYLDTLCLTVNLYSKGLNRVLCVLYALNVMLFCSIRLSNFLQWMQRKQKSSFFVLFVLYWARNTICCESQPVTIYLLLVSLHMNENDTHTKFFQWKKYFASSHEYTLIR